jgi:hypothetical protein
VHTLVFLISVVVCHQELMARRKQRRLMRRRLQLKGLYYTDKQQECHG